MRSRVELDLARAALGRANIEQLGARSRVQVADAVLGRLLGSTQDSGFLPAEVDRLLEEPQPISALIQEALANRPEVRSIQAEMRAAAERVAAAKSESKPAFSLGATGGYARLPKELAGNLVAVGLGLRFPLYTGGRLAGLIQEAEASLSVLESRKKELEGQIVSDVRQAYSRLETARASIAAYAVQNEAAQSALRLAQERYKERLAALVELNSAQAEFVQAAAGEASAFYEVKTAESSLRFAAGRR